MGKILLVDDESSVAWAFERLVELMGHEFLAAATAEEGVELARRETPDIIFMDVRLPGKDGLWAVEEIRKDLPAARIVVITAHGTLETAMRSMKLGAVDYLAKPVDVGRVRRMVEEALGTGSREVERLREETGETGIVGKSQVMQEIFAKVAAVSQSDATVLLVGESGTGKELLARAIHHGSARSGGPFEAINCASIPEALLESELYGHEKGAFTGAIRQKKGKFEISEGGTVFLDEVGDLSPSAQVKLLRFLEDRSFHRVGGTGKLVADVRLLAATNQNLEERIRQDRFREDLYFRLNVIRIEIPPLRERRDDIPLLVAHFLRQTGAEGVADEVMDVFRDYAWPGNVRELRSAVERGSVLARGRVVTPEHLPRSMVAPDVPSDIEERIDAIIGEFVRAPESDRGGLFREVEERWERALIRKVMEKTGGNQMKASRILGINRVTLRKRLRKYGL